MSPENDQCRWVGIRPTNPPEDIPITLDGEVAHVIIDSGGNAGIVPTSIYTYPFNQAVTVNGTWYVSVNVTAPGWLFYAAIYPGQTAINGYIGLTIDGGARMPLQVLPRANYVMQSFRCNLADAFGLEFYGMRFLTSIKVEYMLNAVTSLIGTCMIGYD